ncbi:MAG: TetR/AcrR family transcriptional regulator [Lachnospiraceae bacterium]|jgi:AcrR family transcriptional regulator|nr:TetR/AcrR family transcriptional regulator [Lachnospiraceae bacterium]
MKEYDKKDIQGITVKALCAATPVARTTFYTYFDNTDDVRCEVENDLIKGLLKVSQDISSGNLTDMDFSQFMDETEGYIKDNWTYIYAFLVRQPNLRFIRKWKDAIIMNFRNDIRRSLWLQQKKSGLQISSPTRCVITKGGGMESN